MKIERTWHINEPNTTSGYSTSLTITYSSFDKNEIDAINTVLMSCEYMAAYNDEESKIE